MMTLHKLSAGDGYLYYMREVASGDDVRQRGQKMSDYYLETGNPAGRWMGGGRGLVELDGIVSERQMQLLFGLGYDPRFDDFLKERIAAGQSPEDAIKGAEEDAQLGRAYYRYSLDEDPFVQAVQARIDEAKAAKGRDLEADELREVRLAEAARHFRKDKHREPRDGEELTAYFHAKLRGPAQAVAGYDLTFSPPKSVSTLWAISDKEMAKAIEDCHLEAINDAVKWIEKDAIRTRAGVNGIKQIDVKDGIIAARFRHYESRTGDPQIHDHVVVSNKVCGSDGRWRAIDGALLYKSTVAASERYNQKLAAALNERLGLRFVSVSPTADKRPVLEIEGIDPRLNEVFSKRRGAIKNRVDDLVTEYTERHGRAPSNEQMIRIAQQATLDTRPEKEGGRTLGELRDQWRSEAARALGDEGVTKMLHDVFTPSSEQQQRQLDQIDREAVAVSVVSTVSDNRSVWSHRHIEAETRRQISHLMAGQAIDDDVIDEIVDAALTRGSVKISTDHAIEIERRALLRADDVDVYTRHREELYTSGELLNAEAELVAYARASSLPAISGETFDRVLSEKQNQGTMMSASQIAMARRFATGSAIVMAGIGPAGAGKTTSMKLFADAVTAGGGKVIALAPSRQAARVLGAEIGAGATTIDAWLVSNSQPAAGDVILIDEAGMAGTRHIREVVERAVNAGAHVRLVGDYRQLSAIQSGGALRLIHKLAGGVELEDVFRFADHDEREASLQLREADTEFANPFQWYIDNDRAVGVSAESAATEVFAAWQTDVLDGKESIMLAGDTTTVAELNSQAQAFRLAAGEISTASSVQSRDHHDIGLGDTIVTRRNDPTVLVDGADDASFVTNGARWTVTGIDTDGSITAEAIGANGSVYLPPDYVAAHVQLGYALTVHRAQGVTVDTCHAVLDPDMSRNSAYVALTRGRQLNRAYVIGEEEDPVDVTLAGIASHVDGSGSAHEGLREAMATSRDPIAISHIYQDINGYADRARMRAHVDALVSEGALPAQTAEAVIDSPAFISIVSTLTAAERAGWQPQRLLRLASGQIGNGEDPGALMAWRLSKITEEANERAGETRHLSGVSTDDLIAQHQQARERARTAQQAINVLNARVSHQPAAVELKSGDSAPAWTQRRFGDLDDERLAAHVEMLRIARDADAEFGIDPAAAEDFTAATDEKELRWQMRWVDRAREDFQRDRAADPDRAFDPQATTDFDITQAEHAYAGATELADALRDELHIRAHMPDAPPRPETAPDGMPEWMAPSAALADTHTPQVWRQQVNAARQVLQSKFDQFTATLVDDPPQWAKHVPADDVEAVALWRLEHHIPEQIDYPMPVSDPDTLPAGQRGLYDRVRASAGPQPESAAQRLARIRRTINERITPTDRELESQVDQLRKTIRDRQQRERDDATSPPDPTVDPLDRNSPDPHQGREL